MCFSESSNQENGGKNREKELMIQENVMGVDRSVHVCHDLHAMYTLLQLK